MSLNLLELCQVLKVKKRGKAPQASSKGKGNELFLNRLEHSVLNKACPLENIFYQSLTYWGFTGT